MSALALAAGVVASLTHAQGFCPSYTLSSPNNNGSCAVEAVQGTNPTVAEWQDIFALASRGPDAWTNGPPMNNLYDGCGKPMTRTNVTAKFPCELIKAMAMQESSWKQFCIPSTPIDQKGKPAQTIISFDCGYGVGQVTSGMRSFDPTPNYDRARVASEPFYSMATGMQIFTDKWRFVNCVGDRHPNIIEHWYSAVWAYNGLATKNSPNNATYSTTRGVWNPAVGGSAPYQEKVWGWMQHPPTTGHWTVMQAAYPDLLTVGTGSAPLAMVDPACGSPTSCATSRPTHISECLSGDGGVITIDSGVQPLDSGVQPVDSGVRPMDSGVRDSGVVNPPDAGRNDGGVLTMPDGGPLQSDGGNEPPQIVLLSASPVRGLAPSGCTCDSTGSAGLAAVLAVLLARVRRRLR